MWASTLGPAVKLDARPENSFCHGLRHQPKIIQGGCSHWGRRVVVASLRPPCCRRVIAAASVPPSCGQRPVAGAWVLSPLLPPSRCRRSLHAAPVPPRCLRPCGLRLVVAAFLPPPHCILPDAAVPWLPFHWPAMAGFGHWTPKYDNKLKAVCVQEDTLLSRSASRGCSFFWWRFREWNACCMSW